MAATGRNGYRASPALPIVRRAAVGLADWPRGADPVRVLLVSDLHLSNASTDAARLARVVRQARVLGPDLVLFAGVCAGYDPVAMRSWAPAVAAGFAQFDAPLGRVATLGNHDNEGGRAVAIGAPRASCSRRTAPCARPGCGDGAVPLARHPALGAARGAACARRPYPLRPDPAVSRPALVPASRLYGTRYRCGIVRDGARLVVVTVGIGTSKVPIRVGAPPDMWLLRLGHG